MLRSVTLYLIQKENWQWLIHIHTCGKHSSTPDKNSVVKAVSNPAQRSDGVPGPAWGQSPFIWPDQIISSNALQWMQTLRKLIYSQTHGNLHLLSHSALQVIWRWNDLFVLRFYMWNTCSNDKIWCNIFVMEPGYFPLVTINLQQHLD